MIAAVVQPGVEFDHRKVVGYDSAKARALSRMIEQCEGLVFEAHSTDYQTPAALAALVRDHFAILKVGPALTFALREALWALDAIEREWINPALVSGFRTVVVARMKADPRHWSKYYHAAAASSIMICSTASAIASVITGPIRRLYTHRRRCSGT